MLNIRIDNELKQSLAKRAENEGVTLSDYIRNILEEKFHPDLASVKNTLYFLSRAENELTKALGLKMKAFEIIEEIPTNPNIKPILDLCEKYDLDQIPAKPDDAIRFLAPHIKADDPRLIMCKMNNKTTTLPFTGKDFTKDENGFTLYDRMGVVEHCCSEEVKHMSSMGAQKEIISSTLARITGHSTGMAWMIITLAFTDIKKARKYINESFSKTWKDAYKQIDEHNSKIQKALKNIK